MTDTTTAQPAVSPTAAATPIEKRSLLDDLRVFAQQHRDLARRNYDLFAKQYGSPAERLRAFRERVETRFAKAKSEATQGYHKVEQDIAARTERLRPTRAKASNGSGSL